ncbi:MAG: hypothetical protein ACT6Q3_11800 [Sphingopyxis sp.]
MDILSLLGLFLSVVFAALAWRRTRGLPEASVIRWLVPLFVVAAVPLGIFAWWGQYTPAGRRAFDGLYPLAAGVLTLLLTATAALVGIWARRQAGR